MKPIRPRAEHAQIQVDLRVCANRDRAGRRAGRHAPIAAVLAMLTALPPGVPPGATRRCSSGRALSGTFTVNAAGSTSTLTSICDSVAVMSTSAGSRADRSRSTWGNMPCQAGYSTSQPSRRAARTSPRTRPSQVHRRTALEIDRGPAVCVQPPGDGFRCGNDAAGQDRLQIGRRQAHTGERTENGFRRFTADDTLVARQQQNGALATRGQDETGRAERGDGFEPHRCRALEPGDETPAQTAAAGAPTKAQFGRERPRTPTRRRDVGMYLRVVRKGRAGIRGKLKPPCAARGSEPYAGNAQCKFRKADDATAPAAREGPSRRLHFAFWVLPLALLIFFSIAPRSTSCPSPLSARVHAATASS